MKKSPCSMKMLYSAISGYTETARQASSAVTVRAGQYDGEYTCIIEMKTAAMPPSTARRQSTAACPVMGTRPDAAITAAVSAAQMR